MQYYQRALSATLLPSDTRRKKVVLLFGARQCGKTTLLRHLTSSQSCLHLNLQDRQLRRRYETDVGLLVRELRGRADIATVCIDEIQKVPMLLDDVQLLYDDDPERYQFLLTGSSARQLRRGSANLLPGRAQQFLLSPVLQVEQRPVELLPLSMPSGTTFPTRSLESYLLYGNLPGLYSEDQASWERTLETYVDLYIEHEIRQEHIVQDMGAFVRFLRVAALEAGQAVNYSKLANAIGVAVNTIRNFFQVLDDTFVGVRIGPFASGRRQIISAPRFVLFDIGVRHVLANVPATQTLLTLDAGHVFEQWVMAELYYRCVYHGRGYRLSTWRTRTGAEVDVIVETPTELLPIEIKWTDRPQPSDARHVETFIALHADRCQRGYVVCRTPHRQQLTDRVVALPWDAF